MINVIKHIHITIGTNLPNPHITPSSRIAGALFCAILLGWQGTALGADRPTRSPQQQADLNAACFEKYPGCYAAIFDMWRTNGVSETAFASFLPPRDRVPSLMRGTSMEGRMLEVGALNNCMNNSNACRDLIGQIVDTFTSSPKDFQRAYEERQKELFNRDEKKTLQDEERFRSNLETRLSGASVSLERGDAGTPELITNANKPVPEIAEGQRNNTGSSAGKVLDFARDELSGVTYQLVVSADGNRELQRRTSGSETEILATVAGREGKWLVETPNNVTTFEAEDLRLTARGVVMLHRNSVVSYRDGEGWSKFSWPAGWEVAGFQRGDVSGSGYTLLERPNSGRSSSLNPLASISQLGFILGASRREDYALLDLHSGKLFPLNVSNLGKNQVELSGCRPKNRLVNICSGADSRERLRTSIGFKNLGHYAWAIDWYRTANGTFLVALEDGSRRVTLTLLEKDDKRVAFDRSLGYADFASNASSDGIVSVSVFAAFQRESIANIAQVFDTLKKYPVQ